MSHTWAHKQLKKKYPKVSKYLKNGKLNLDDLPQEIVKPEDSKGITFTDIEDRLTQLEEKLKDEKF